MKNYTWIIVVIIIILMILGFFGLLYLYNHSPQKLNPNQNIIHYQDILCNNTQIISDITGKQWVAENSNKFININLNLTKNGDRYSFWLENLSYYTKPITFTSDCENTNESQIIKIENYISGNVTINLTDPTTNQTSLSISCKDVVSDKVCKGITKIEYNGKKGTSFMPFGGIMFLEYPLYFTNIACNSYESDIANYAYDYAPYIPSTVKNTYRPFQIADTLDNSSGETKHIYCFFEIPPKFLDYVHNQNIYIEFVPSNWWITNDSTLRLGIDKWSDGDFTRTGKGDIVKTIKIQ